MSASHPGTPAAEPAKERPPIVKPLRVSEVGPNGYDATIEATSSQREALAKDNNLVAVSAFSARLHIRKTHGDGLAVRGELRALARQVCVATLEEFDTELVEPIDIRFAPPEDRDAPGWRGIAQDVDMDSEDPPDPLIGGEIDLGAVVCEFFTLALDPYPRKPGAAFAAPEAATKAPSPFAALQGAATKSGREDDA